jgi:cytosine/adenosine deaminase-related metal-dependent hydrolase
VAAGALADLLVLDWNKLAEELVEPDVPPLDLLLARARREHVKGLIVAGRDVVRDGVVQGVDLPALEAELLATLRGARSSTADVRAAMPELKAALARHYAGPLYCA